MRSVGRLLPALHAVARAGRAAASGALPQVCSRSSCLPKPSSALRHSCAGPASVYVCTARDLPCGWVLAAVLTAALPLLQVKAQRGTASGAGGSALQQSLTLLQRGVEFELQHKCCNVQGATMPFDTFLVRINRCPAAARRCCRCMPDSSCCPANRRSDCYARRPAAGISYGGQRRGRGCRCQAGSPHAGMPCKPTARKCPLTGHQPGGAEPSAAAGGGIPGAGSRVYGSVAGAPHPAVPGAAGGHCQAGPAGWRQCRAASRHWHTNRSGQAGPSGRAGANTQDGCKPAGTAPAAC